MSEGEPTTLLGGRYVIDGLVESGGRGEIYVAHRTGPGDDERTLAVKRIRESLSDDPVAVERFLREADLAAQLHHPNVVEVIELGNEAGEYYIVMELLHGKTLRRILERLAERQRACHPGIGARVLKGVAEALDYAHNFVVDGERRPIVHRDVNLENIMVTVAGQVKLLDFGLARDLGDIAAVTQAGEMLGQPVYLAPECVRGAPTPAPPRDVYSLGVVGFMALSGGSPFPVEPGPAGLAKLFHAITDGPTPRLSGDLPAELVELIAMAMAREPSARPSARQMSDRCAAYLGSDPSAAATKLSALLEELFGDDEEAPLPVLDGGLGARPSGEPVREQVMALDDHDLIEIGTTELAWAELGGSGAGRDAELGPAAGGARSEPMDAAKPSSRGEAPLPGWTDEVDEDTRSERPKGATRARPLASVHGRGFRLRLRLGKTRRRAFRALRWGTVVAAVVVCAVYWDVLAPAVDSYLRSVETAGSHAASWIGEKAGELEALAEEGPVPPRSQVPVVEPPPPDAGDEAVADTPPTPTGTLEVRCRWGWVKVDGRTVGNCPHVTKELPVGHHVVTFERAAGVITRQIRIGKNRVLKLDLVPKRRVPGEIEIGLEDGPMP